MLNFLKKISSWNTPTWTEIERFDSSWRARIERMSSFITDEDVSIVDVGCGPMWLREYISENVKYTGIDYIYRGEGMTVADLNNGKIPVIPADVWFVSGCLEYLNEPALFIDHVAQNSQKCILSYCDLEKFPSAKERKSRGWRNHLTSEQITEFFKAKNMRRIHFEILPSSNSIFVFDRRRI